LVVLHPLYQIAAFVIGACLGSFLNVAILRIPEDRSLWSPPSHCGVCQTPIEVRDNIPILSWLLLRGRCRHCGTVVSPMYPLVELLMGLVGWLMFRRFVPTPASMDPVNLAAFAVYLMLAWLLLLAAFTDIRGRIIPEIASSQAVPAGLIAVATLDALGYHGWLAMDWRTPVVGTVVVTAFFFGLSRGWRLAFGQEGLAMGDTKLIAMITAFIGPLPGALLVLFMASILGAGVGIGMLIANGRQVYLPFAPSLSFATLVYVLYGDVIIHRWLPSYQGLI
jgi:leader peptidase (prepilin peptidase)/N-methyltransferase